jgi:hypothetical protein
MKRGLRQSLFSRSRTPLPEPWIEIKSLVGKPMFINSDTGASTNVDPRLRAFPVHRQDRRAGIRSTEYMEAYNNTGLSTCKEYWGHLGRVRTTRPRMIPTVFCLLFVVFASFQVIKGFLCIYNTPAYQLVTIMTLWGVVLKSSGYFAFFTAIYALWSIFSVLALRGASARAIKGTGSPNVI